MPATTTPVSWPIKRLFDLKEGGSSGRLLIPTYQRGLVWDEGRRKELISSIQSGLPIGSLLIWERTIANEKQYHLIDGLQRTNSIFAYLESPLVDFDPDWLEGEELDRFVDAVWKLETTGQPLDSIFKSQVVSQLKVWLSETKSKSPAFSGYSVATAICDGLGIPVNSRPELDGLVPFANDLCDAIDQKSDILNYELPVIIYEGPEESLPHIFEKINSTGVALTKYDKFAASWQAFTTRINEPDIRRAIQAKYKQLLDKGFEFADYNPDDSDQYNLYEYLFGLGKFLADEYPGLIHSNAEAFDVESLAFSVATVVHGLRLSEMATLPNRFDQTGGLVDPSVFQIALSDSFEKFGNIVKPIYDLRLNTKAGGRVNISIPEYQLASYIARLLVGKYSPPSFTEKEGWQVEWDSELPKGIRHSYLLDILQQHWRGSGDSKLFGRVWNDERSDGLDDTYKLIRDRESWDAVLNAWFDESLQSSQRDRAPVRWIDRMVLRFVYMSIVSVMDNSDVEYEIDHVIPVDVLRKLMPANDPGWPISNIANLTLLSKTDNKKKSTETLWEYTSRLAKEGHQSEVETIRALAISPLEICGIPNPNSKTQPDKAWFVDFLRTRFMHIKDALYNSIDV
jgi:hypothetical protein